MPCDPACRGPLEPSKPWGQVAAPGLGRSRRQQLTGSKSQSGETRRLRARRWGPPRDTASPRRRRAARRRMAKTANLTSCMFCHNKRFQSSIFLNKSKDKISAGMARAGTRDRGPEPRAPFQSEAGGRVCPFPAVGGGGSATGERPTGLPGRWGLAHQASGRRVRAPLTRTSPHAGTSRIREAAAGACGSGSGSDGSRSLSAGDTAASGLARMAGPTHALPFAPPATSSPGHQLSHGEPDWGTGGDVRAQALLQNTDQENEVSAARGSSWRRSAAPPPTPHFTQTPSCSLSQHATRVRWRQPPRSLHGAEREEGPGARGLVERPSLGRGVRCARPCQLAGCTLSEYQHQEGHGTGPTFSAAPPETGHADVHTSQQQPPPMTQATVRTVSRELACVWAKSISGMRTWALAPGQQEAASPGVRGSLGLCPALACPPAGEAGPMSRRRPRDSRPCSRGPQRPRLPPRPRPGGSDVRCSRADLPPAV